MKNNTALRKITALLLSLALIISLSSAPVFADNGENSPERAQNCAENISGSGSISDPYIINTADELSALSALSCVGYARLEADIDMTGFDGTYVIKKLSGDFDGQGHTIRNLTLSGGQGTFMSPVNTGFVGELNGSIRNLILDNVSIGNNIGNYNNVGAFAGSAASTEDTYGTDFCIDNCIASGSILASSGGSYTFIGAFLGLVSGSIDNTTVLNVNNCVSAVDITAPASSYAGGIIGSAQYFSTVNISSCAVLEDISGRGKSGGIIGYINSSDTALNISNSYVGGKIDGSEKFGIAYNLMALKESSYENFYYNSDKNRPAYSWESFNMLRRGSAAAEGKTEDELKSLNLDGFEVRNGEFSGFPVPVWTPSDPPTPPAPEFSCDVKFDGTQDGTITLIKDSEQDTPIEPENGIYHLFEKGQYHYTITNLEDYEDCEGSFALGDSDNNGSKTIFVRLTYKTVELRGSGSEESPYLISSAKELYSFAAAVNSGTASTSFAVLENDILANGSFTPIGKNAVFPFKGVFDGNGHSVKITVDNPRLSYFGFFGCLENAIVKDLTINGEIYCSEPSAYVGGLSGRARGNVIIENCTNNASVSALASGSASIGGLIGGYDDNVEYKWESICLLANNCKNNGIVMAIGASSDTYIGGIVGTNKNCVKLSECENNGSIYAPNSYVGGLLGHAGYRTGDCYPEISSCTSSGVLFGAEGKTNRLYGKGTISEKYITDSGSNAYENGSETENILLAEAIKYIDSFAVSSDFSEGSIIPLLKSGESASEDVSISCSQGEYDTNKGYISCSADTITLSRLNDTKNVIRETATLCFSDNDGNSLRKPITINIYPSEDERVLRRALINRIAETYRGKSDDWMVFDMAVYEKLGFGANTTDTENYLNLTVNLLSGNSALVSERAKSEIILAALDTDSTRLTPFEDSVAFSNPEKLLNMNLTSSIYTAPWVLLAEEGGQLELNDNQRNSLISVLTENQSENGLFISLWGGEKYNDPDSTAIALCALSRFKNNENVSKFIQNALDGLSKVQGANGSFGNANSDAMVIIALAALGINPETDPRFVKSGASLASAILLSVNDSRDGFTAGYMSGEEGENATRLATEQGFRALLALEALESFDSFNIYTVAKNGNEIIPSSPKKDYAASGKGTVSLPEDESAPGSGTVSEANITVSLSVISDNNSEWLSKTLAIPQGATAAAALKKAFSECGMSASGFENGYITSVTKGGITLSQFDKGDKSGWMYKVNGKAHMVGISDYTLKNGDTLVLYYTNDYSKDSEGKTMVGSSSSSQTEYTITFDSCGGSEVKSRTASNGTSISAPENPKKEGFDFIGWFTDKELTQMYDFSLKVSADITLYAAWREAKNVSEPEKFSYADVFEQDWYFESVKYVCDNNIMNGISENEFAPNDFLTRAMFITILYRLEGEPEAAEVIFADTEKGSWYEKAVSWATECGIAKGTSANTFSPNEYITREQIAVMLNRYAEFKKLNLDFSDDIDPKNYADYSEISAYARPSFEYALKCGILNGKSPNTLNPLDTASRAEAAAIIMRFLKNI